MNNQNNDLIKNFIEEHKIKEITKDKVLDLFNAFQDLLISNNFLN